MCRKREPTIITRLTLCARRKLCTGTDLCRYVEYTSKSKNFGYNQVRRYLCTIHIYIQLYGNHSHLITMHTPARPGRWDGIHTLTGRQAFHTTTTDNATHVNRSLMGRYVPTGTGCPLSPIARRGASYRHNIFPFRSLADALSLECRVRRGLLRVTVSEYRRLSHGREWGWICIEWAGMLCASILGRVLGLLDSVRGRYCYCCYCCCACGAAR